MKRHSSKALYKKGVWDLGGTLNELDTPSEAPDRDVSQIQNWKAHKDGKSRIKRPGYDRLDNVYSLIGLIKILDEEDGSVIVTENRIYIRGEVFDWACEDVNKIADVGRIYSFCEWNDALLAGAYGGIYERIGTDNWNLVDDLTWIDGYDTGSYPCHRMVRYNNYIYIATGLDTKVTTESNPGNVIEWKSDGDWSVSLNNGNGGLFMTTDLAVDPHTGHLLALSTMKSGGDDYYRVNWFDTSSWHEITDYDGDTEIDSGHADWDTNGFQVDEFQPRIAHFVVFHNKVYMIVAVWDSVNTRTSFEVWALQYDASDLPNNFTKIYDSSDDSEYNYVPTSVVEYKDQVYLICLETSSTAAVKTDDNVRIFTSADMLNWKTLLTDNNLGAPMDAIVHKGELFVNCIKINGDSTLKLQKYNPITQKFELEATKAEPEVGTWTSGGALFSYDDVLWASNWDNACYRYSDTVKYTEVFYQEEAVREPGSIVRFGERPIYGGFDSNLVIEGDQAWLLGIYPPLKAPSLATADGTAVTNESEWQGDGTEKFFTLVLDHPYIQKSSVTVSYTIGATGYDATDDGKGNISGTSCSGSVYYDRGLIVLEFDTAPDNATDIEVDYRWSNLHGKYRYVVTFYRSGNYPCESNPTPESAVVTAEGKKVNLTSIPTSVDPKVDTRRIYRTLANGAIFYWLVDIEDNSTTTYTDDIHDDSLGDEVSYNRLPPKKGNLFEVWDNRLWIAGNPEYPNMVYFTNTNTAEEMGAANFIPIKRRGGEDINQIKAFGDKLYVFKKSSFYEITKYGDSLYEVVEMPQHVGADAPWSVAVCDKVMTWKSKYGIEVFNGADCFRPVLSEKIHRTIDTINNEYLNKIVGGHNFKDHEYWLLIPTGSATEPDKVIVFDYLKVSFTTYTFYDTLTCLSTVRDFITGNLVALTGTADGNLYIVDNDYYTDDGELISASFKTGWFNVTGEHEMWNMLRRMFILYNIPAGKTITLNIYTNYNETAVASISLAGSTPSPDDVARREILKRVNLGIRGYHVMFEFVNNENAGGECRIRGWDMYFRRKVWKHSSEGD